MKHHGKEISREDFLDKFALEYLQRHPDQKQAYARRQARLRWAKKIKLASRATTDIK